jgi:Domain of unknown function (DUF4157)
MSAKAAPEAKTSQTPEAKSARSFTAASKPLLLRKCACGSSSGGGECEECSKNQLPLQRSAAGHDGMGSVPPIVNDALSSPGRPLDAPARDFMESRFGHDFGHVRIHTDGQAAESARAVNAHAYTVGQDIVFDHGKYDPHSESGQHLLAHELAHTIQQQGLRRSAVDSIGPSHGAEYIHLEREADAAANAAMSGAAPQLARPAPQPMLSRAPAGGKVVPARSAKPKTKQSKSGSHKVTPVEGFEAAGGKIEEFEVDVFYLPSVKGAAAKSEYEAIAGQKLETVVQLNGTGRTKTALWQKREPTDELRSRWLGKLGWTDASKNDLWKRAGGDAEFPKVGGATCQMDHIVELQLGGDNTNENIQPLEADPNRKSGGEIRSQLESLAVTVSEDSALASDDIGEVKLRFGSVKLATISGTTKALPAKCPTAQATCLGVEKCAKELKLEKDESGVVTIARDDYPVSVGGGSPRNLKAPITFKSNKKEVVPIEGDAINDAASTLIPGLLMTELAHTPKATTDLIKARIDDRPQTRLPISLNPNTKPIRLNVGAAGVLTIDPADKKVDLAFTYKYLSPGHITSLALNDSGGVDWAGYIQTGIPFLGRIDIAYSKGELKVTKGLDPEAIKKKSFLGAKITKAELSLLLAPEFKPEGRIEFEIGQQLATGFLTVSKDDVGLVATGKLKVNIPKMETAETDITYKGGGGRDEWNAQIQIKTENIKLGSSVSVTGGFIGMIDKEGIQFTGKINATFPGSPPNTAELGLQKGKTGWILFGGGTFNFPKIDPVTVKITYDLEKDKLVATGKTGFQIPSIGLGGRLDEVTFVITKDEPVKVSGKGGLDYKSKNGKAEGHVDVTLHPTGKFSGKGSLTYKIKENLIVTGIVELDNNQKLRVTGELLVTRYELFKKYEKKKELIDPPLNIPIPIPGLSIGTSGVVFLIQGGVGVSISFGPGALEPLKLTAGFDPLENDPDFKATVTASVKVPAEATLSAWISGSLALQVDIGIGSAGVDGGLKLQGDLTLRAGAFANLDAAYEKKRLTAKLVAGIETKLLLGLTLSAFARAWAGAFGIRGEVRKDWILAKKTIDPGLSFSLSAPFEYADDIGVKLPELKDITLKKPEFDFKRVLGQVFGEAPEKKTES